MERIGNYVLGVALAATITAGMAHVGSWDARAAAAGAAVTPPTVSADTLLRRADIFRDCQTINGRWQCRHCTFVRRCTRALGCQWVERCRWGPPVAPIPQ